MQDVCRLAPSLPTLGRLASLTMSHVGLVDLPASLTRALSSLTHLNISGNKCKRLPSSLKIIRTLRELTVSGNERMELTVTTLDVIAALPSLEILVFFRKLIRYERYSWYFVGTTMMEKGQERSHLFRPLSSSTATFLQNVQARCPCLRMIGEG